MYVDSNEIEDARGLRELQLYIDGEILPQLHKLIGNMDAGKFDDLQETLLTFILTDWKENYSFTTIYLIGEIFGYITQ